jgi:hypothetical protein
MRRWNPLSLVALLVVALLATVLMTPRGALAAPSSTKGLTAPTTNFKGKVVAKNSLTHYFVFTFTCSNGTLSGKWTYEVSSALSFTGTTGTTAPCELTSASPGSGVSYSNTSIPLLLNVNGQDVEVGTLSLLSLTNIVASKTFFGTFVSPTTGDCTSINPGSPCVAVATSDLVIPTPPTTVAGFSLVAGSFSTLNLSAH